MRVTRFLSALLVAGLAALASLQCTHAARSGIILRAFREGKFRAAERLAYKLLEKADAKPDRFTNVCMCVCSDQVSCEALGVHTTLTDSLGTRAIAAQKDRAGALNVLGAIAYRNGTMDIAARFLQRATELDPANPHLAVNYATALSVLGDVRGVDLLQRVAARHPDMRGALVQLGVALEARGHREAATWVLARALGEEGGCLSWGGAAADAHASANASAAVEAQADVEAWGALCRLRVARGEYDAAVRACAAAGRLRDVLARQWATCHVELLMLDAEGEQLAAGDDRDGGGDPQPRSHAVYRCRQPVSAHACDDVNSCALDRVALLPSQQLLTYWAPRPGAGPPSSLLTTTVHRRFRQGFSESFTGGALGAVCQRRAADSAHAAASRGCSQPSLLVQNTPLSLLLRIGASEFIVDSNVTAAAATSPADLPYSPLPPTPRCAIEHTTPTFAFDVPFATFYWHAVVETAIPVAHAVLTHVLRMGGGAGAPEVPVSAPANITLLLLSPAAPAAGPDAGAPAFVAELLQPLSAHPLVWWRGGAARAEGWQCMYSHTWATEAAAEAAAAAEAVAAAESAVDADQQPPSAESDDSQAEAETLDAAGAAGAAAGEQQEPADDALEEAAEAADLACTLSASGECAPPDDARDEERSSEAAGGEGATDGETETGGSCVGTEEEVAALWATLRPRTDCACAATTSARLQCALAALPERRVCFHRLTVGHTPRITSRTQFRHAVRFLLLAHRAVRAAPPPFAALRMWEPVSRDSADAAAASASVPLAPETVRVTIVQRAAAKGRVIADLGELQRAAAEAERLFDCQGGATPARACADWLGAPVRLDVRVVDFAQMSVSQQMATVQATDVLVGTHGSGWANAAFLPQHAVGAHRPPPALRLALAAPSLPPPHLPRRRHPAVWVRGACRLPCAAHSLRAARARL